LVLDKSISGLSLINDKTLLRIDDTKTISNNASLLNETDLKRSF